MYNTIRIATKSEEEATARKKHTVVESRVPRSIKNDPRKHATIAATIAGRANCGKSRDWSVQSSELKH